VAGVIDWLPVRGFHHGPVRQGRPEKRPQIRLQSVLLAITSLPSDSPTQGDDELTPASHLTGGVQIPLVSPLLRSPRVGLPAWPRRVHLGNVIGLLGWYRRLDVATSVTDQMNLAACRDLRRHRHRVARSPCAPRVATSSRACTRCLAEERGVPQPSRRWPCVRNVTRLLVCEARCVRETASVCQPCATCTLRSGEEAAGAISPIARLALSSAV